MLRNFLTPTKSGSELALVEQADKLRSQTTFPDTASNNQVRTQETYQSPACIHS